MDRAQERPGKMENGKKKEENSMRIFDVARQKIN